MKLKDLGEDALIDIITAAHPPKTGSGVEKAIGDDTSVTKIEGSPSSLLVTTDTLVEGLHFDDSYSTPKLLGRKLLSVSLSDIAAMGGRAKYFLISLTLSPDTDDDYVRELYRGLNERAEEAGAVLIGGNTTSTGGAKVLTSTVIGEVDSSKVVYRSGALASEDIYMTGTIGDSALGLKMLRDGQGEVYKEAVSRHLDPTARLQAGALLGERSLATSMLDISDGLIKDLSRLTKENGIGAELIVELLPLSSDGAEYIGLNPEAYELLLAGGEDYELLFTANKGKAKEIADLSQELDLSITRIGETTCGKEVVITDKNKKPIKIERKGFEHFK